MLALPRSSSRPPYQRAWTLALSVPQLLGWGSLYYAFSVLIGPMEVELHISRLELAGAFSLGLFVEGVMAYPVGRFVDRGKARWVMPLGSLLAAMGLWMLALSQHRWEVYAAWAVLGCAMAMVLYTASFAVVTRRFPLHYRRAILTLSLLGGLASTVFIPLVAWLVRHVGWRQALEFLALLQLLVCVPLHAALLHEPEPSMAGRVRPAIPPVAELRQLLRSGPYLQVCAFVLLMTAVSAALPIHLVSVLRAFQLQDAWAVMVPASLGLFQVASRLLLYLVEKRLDRHLVNRTIPALIPLGLLMLLSASVVAPTLAAGFALAFVALFGMGNGMLTIVKGTAMAQYVSHRHAASLNGALGIPLAFARATAPLAFAALWSATLGYGPGIAVLLVLSLVGVGALWLAQGSPGATSGEVGLPT